MKISAVTAVPDVAFMNGACQGFYVATIASGFDGFDEGDGKFAMHRAFPDDAGFCQITLFRHSSLSLSLSPRKPLEFTPRNDSAESSFQIYLPIFPPSQKRFSRRSLSTTDTVTMSTLRTVAP